MFLATQYYRPPFPSRKYWADDLSKVRDSGLHAIQLWCLWGWIEAEPGVYRYEDYDELVRLADARGLKVVLSTIAEIHPFWIHRLVLDSQLVDHLGRKVVSCPRNETNTGLTPGGCFDHPRVREMMGRFLTDIASRYAGAGNLIGWDCWNETRWAVHSDGYVCYCPHTLREFRSWLDRRHGGLEGLNAAWQRRYTSWDDVYPAKRHHGPYVDVMEFLRFLTVRAAEHAGFRYEAIRAGDPKRLISAHCGTPAIQSTGGGAEQALIRGVDWDLADRLDGFGCSHFPFWFSFDENGFGIRVEEARSANAGKVMWVSELQGGSARGGIGAMQSVPAEPQQRWVANGMARGAKAVIFWCWRDEVFCSEASGFGLSGWDGLADRRLEAMKKTAAFIDRHDALIERYRPDQAKVGVLFVPDNYLLKWAEAADAREAADGVVAYATVLERLRIPYDFVEARHLDALEHLDVLLMPWCLVIPDVTRKAIEKFLRRGGRILVEAEADAFGELGWYRYPDERPFMQMLGLHDTGRRLLESPLLSARVGERTVELGLDNFTTPLKATAGAEVLAVNARHEALLVRRKVGEGAAYVVGSFLGRAYLKQRSEGLEHLIQHVCDDAGVRRDFDVDAGDGNEMLQWRSGASGKDQLLWIINGGGQRTVTVTDQDARFRGKASARELVSATELPIRAACGSRQCAVEIPAGGFAVLKW